MILEVNCHGRKRKTKIGNTIIPRLRPVWAEAEHRDPENREKGRKGATVVRVCACDPAATALSLSLSLAGGDSIQKCQRRRSELREDDDDTEEQANKQPGEEGSAGGRRSNW
jgi:hypothetical protein